VHFERFVEVHIVLSRVLIRAQGVFDAMLRGKTALPIPDTAGREIFSVEATPHMQILDGAMLFLTLVSQVISVWEGESTGVPLRDPMVDAAIARMDRPALRDFRNAVIHTKRINDEDEIRYGERLDEQVPLAEAMLTAMADYLRPILHLALERWPNGSPE
jgi:hypothetical protein